MHTSVLLDETIDSVVTDTNGIYIDATFGAGGHSRALLSRLAPHARLVALDRDASVLDTHAIQDNRLTVLRSRFGALSEQMHAQGLDVITGMIADFGVSSMQLDTAERGFSFRHDAPLDMRMDQSSGTTAGEWINSANEEAIANVLYHYGEEKRSRAIARAVVQARTNQPFTRTTQLADCIGGVIGRRGRIHPATRSFQAIRIYINNELDEIATLLEAAWQLLQVGGRLACISFHSLEDRLVKHTFAGFARSAQIPSYIPLTHTTQSYAKLLGKRKPTTQEIASNPRARSAILRTIEKTAIKETPMKAATKRSI